MKLCLPLTLRLVLFAPVLISAVRPAALRAEDWPHWRGPRRNDVSAEPSGWNGTQWLAAPPTRPVWGVELGEGSSSPIVVQGRLYALSWQDGREMIRCLDAAVGTELWRHDWPAPRYGRFATGDEGLYSGPSSTPSLDPATGLLFVLGNDGELRCLDARADGRLVWRKNLYDGFGVKQRPKVGRSGLRDYGYTSSPLVLDGMLIVEAGAPDGNLIAFEKRSGRELWKSQDASPAGHNGGPVPLTIDGTPCVAVMNHEGLLVVRLDAGHAGRTVAFVPWRTEFANNIATPAVHGSSVIVTSGYNHGKIARFDVSLGGARQVWEQQAESLVCSPVIVDGFVYWVWRQVHCLDFATGKKLWSAGNYGDPGSLIATRDGRLIGWAGSGDLLLIESARRSPEKLTLLSEHRGLARSDAWPHAVLSDGRLFLRDRSGRLICLAVAGS